MKTPIALSAAFLALSTPALSQSPPQAAQTGTEADHVALRKLKSELVQAINARDFETARTLVHKPMLATAVTQDSFNDFDSLVDFYNSLFTRDTLRMKEVRLNAEADELSQIYTGTFAITRGSTNEHYVLADGRSFDLKGRWTATSIKEPEGNWRLLAIHSGTNFLDNPVLTAAAKSAMWVGIGAGVIGILLGFLVGRLTKRRQAAAPGA